MTYNEVVYGSVVDYMCLPGYRLFGAATRICGNYSWSDKSPVCEGEFNYTGNIYIYIYMCVCVWWEAYKKIQECIYLYIYIYYALYGFSDCHGLFKM